MWVLFSAESVALYNPMCMHKVIHVYCLPFFGIGAGGSAWQECATGTPYHLTSWCPRKQTADRKWGQAINAQGPSPSEPLPSVRPQLPPKCSTAFQNSNTSWDQVLK